MGCFQKERSGQRACEGGGGVYKTADLEDPEERKQRWRSIRIVYFTMFMMSLGFSIVLTGVWPYLDKLDPSAGKQFMGFVVAANPLGQMLCSPLFGYWANRVGSIRGPMIFSLALFTLSSAGYALLDLFPTESVKFWMVGFRLMIGISSANTVVCRSYLSAATTLRERTGAISKISLAQVLGFIVGPSIQALVTPLGDDGVTLFGGLVSINMYSASGWINALLSLVNLLLFLPGIFCEQSIAGKEAMRAQGAATEKDTWSGKRIDYFAAWTLILAFFTLVFDFVLLETLGTSLVMDQFAWTKKEALYYMGILMSAGAVVAVFTFAVIKPLCKWFDERTVMIFGGFLMMVIGRGLYVPWGSEPAKLMIPGEAVNGTEPVGCPVATQPWCEFTRGMTIAQLITGYAFTSVGYPIGITLIQTLFSKILGTRPQGVWMGLITGSGCFARVLGPIFVSYVYVTLGTVWTFSLTTVLLALWLLWLYLTRSRLVPEPISTVPASQQVHLMEMAACMRKPIVKNGAGKPEEMQALTL